MRSFVFDDITIIMGQNVKDNEKLLDAYNHTDFVFMHLKSFPSSHVVIMSNKPSSTTLDRAAMLCKRNTKYRHIKGIKAVHTAYNNVCRTNVPGMVTFESNRQVKDFKIKEFNSMQF
jgi:predicted ribosome quality control (RQC) complex YloA/Tae2 family protein